MKKPQSSLKNITPKKVLQSAKTVLLHHSPVILTIVAGLLIGFALYSVANLTNSTSQQVFESGSGDQQPLSGLNIDENLKSTLASLSEDQDVVISSDIVNYRRSAFSDDSAESEWVIDAAEALEDYYDTNKIYPRRDQIVKVLSDAAVSPEDRDNRVVNSEQSVYSYSPSICDNDGCKSFTLSEDFGTSTYQLGEKDIIRRTWVNDTSSALVSYGAEDESNSYPTEKQFIEAMQAYYQSTFEKDFVSEDPSGKNANSEGSTYAYRGVNCTSDGCQGYVLRTTFNDGALYFRQSNL